MLIQCLMTREIVTSVKIYLKYKQAILAIMTHGSYHCLTKSDKKLLGKVIAKADNLHQSCVTSCM
jgi:hypothetical protein